MKNKRVAVKQKEEKNKHDKKKSATNKKSPGTAPQQVGAPKIPQQVGAPSGAPKIPQQVGAPSGAPKRGPGIPVLRLNNKIKEEICQLIVEGYNNSVISEFILEQYEIPISRQCIHENYRNGRKWKKYITSLAAKPDSWKLHPLAKKGNRLILLQDAINKSLEKTVRSRFGKFGEVTQTETEYKQVGNVSGLIREARAETEGDSQPASVQIVFGHRQPAGQKPSMIKKEGQGKKK